jgi:hypothetical protein
MVRLSRQAGSRRVALRLLPTVLAVDVVTAVALVIGSARAGSIVL